MAIREFQLYNSKTKQKEIFIPNEPGKVGIYVGGLTDLDLNSHTGHLRPHLAVYILDGYLTHLGYKVTHVRELTSSFDIHGGGSMDLIIPKYWMDNGFVDSTNNNENMSKYLGTIQEIQTLYHLLALRYLMMTTHYRTPVDYSEEDLEFASESLFNLYQTLQDCEQALYSIRESNPVVRQCGILRVTPKVQECIDELRHDFYAKMSDDLQTQDFLNGRPLREFLSLMKQFKTEEPDEHSLYMSLTVMQMEVGRILKTLGLMSPLPSCYSEILTLLGEFKDMALKRAKLTKEDVFQQIQLMIQAREDKKFMESDQIRLNLAAKGICLMELENGTILWRPCARRLETGETAQ